MIEVKDLFKHGCAGLGLVVYGAVYEEVHNEGLELCARLFETGQVCFHKHTSLRAIKTTNGDKVKHFSLMIIVFC